MLGLDHQAALRLVLGLDEPAALTSSYSSLCTTLRCSNEDAHLAAPPPGWHVGPDKKRYCWNCLSHLHPQKTKLKVRKEHIILAEFQRLIHEKYPGAIENHSSLTWDCKIPGGCTQKRPDLIYIFSDKYLQIEVDEFGHSGYDKEAEESRLHEICSDVCKPGLVIRLVIRIDPDTPLSCFIYRRKTDGERVVGVPTQGPKRIHFDSLMSRAVEAAATFLLSKEEQADMLKVICISSS